MEPQEEDLEEKERREKLRQLRIASGRAALERAGGSGAFEDPGIQYAAGLAAQGMQSHANAAGNLNAALSKEMDSRVAQQREMRRMAHEKEMMRMRLEAQRRDEEGGIIRSLLNG